MGQAPGSRAAVTTDGWVLPLLSILPFALLAGSALVPSYGYFIDEFYYIACSKHLALGYVDQPPFAPWLLALTRPLHHDTMLGIRILAALAAAATVWVSGLLARRLGGGRAAVIVTALVVGFTPVFLAMSSFYSMNAFEPLLWTLVVYTLVRLVDTGNSRLWVVAGLLVGAAVQNKHTAAAFVGALVVGLLVTRARQVLRDPWAWAGAALAAAVVLPNIAWQASNGWPSLEFYRAAHLSKNVYSPPLRSTLAMLFVLNPLTFPLWAGGLWWLTAGRGGRQYRFAGVMAAVVILEYVFSGSSRPDRPFATFPLLFAAGAGWFERLTAAHRRWRWLVAPVVAASLALLPLGVPLLSPKALAGYVSALGLRFQIERGKTSPIPQTLADRTGWESFLDDATRAFRSLSFEDQRRAIFFAPDYGHAGALELWGPARGLPRVVANHNSYWHWSAGRTNTEVLIAVGGSPKALHALFKEVDQVGWVDCQYCMSWRSHMPIYVARGSIAPVESVWGRFKHYE